MSDRPDGSQRGEMAASISSAVVKLVREYTGRGPTKTRTYIDENLISVVLEDTLTMGERSLVRDGQSELVLASRRAFQRTMAAELTAAVEQYSGRTVRAFLSANNIDPDIAVESFILDRVADPAGESADGEEQPDIEKRADGGGEADGREQGE